MTDVVGAPAGARFGWVRTVAVVGVLAAGAAVLARTTDRQQPPTGAVAEDLADRVATLMETRFRAELTPRRGPVSCVAHPFGTRPERVARAAEVRTVYAWVECAVPPAGGRADAEVTLPVAVLLADPPAVRVPDRGDDYASSVRRIFPADVRDAMAAVDPR